MSKYVIRSRAPLRISFAGGGTDVAPFADERGGLVLNATINRYAYVTIVPNGNNSIVLHSLDYDQSVEFNADAAFPPIDGNLDLAKGVIKSLGLEGSLRGFSLYTHTDCPPGSGLGASSTMVVALLGAFNAWLNLGYDRYEIAQRAVDIERNELGIHGGKQDQYAAAFGGFNYMEFTHDAVIVNPLRIPSNIVSELEYSLVLAYTGQSRLSGKIIENQISNFREGNVSAVAAMEKTKKFAYEMKRALLTSNLVAFSGLLHAAWQEKKRMSNMISSSRLDEIYSAALAAGAHGGKASGAGGGGFMFFYAEFDKRQTVISALEELGVAPVLFGFTDNGLQTWTVPRS